MESVNIQSVKLSDPFFRSYETNSETVNSENNSGFTFFSLGQGGVTNVPQSSDSLNYLSHDY